jgi:hypothetical protein
MDIALTEGYKDPQGLEHRNVTFGKRLDGATLFSIDEDPQSDIQTQFQLLTLRATITAFGTLTMPVTLDALLKLDGVDIDDLVKAHNKFMAEGLDGRQFTFVSDSEATLAIGYTPNSLTYTKVIFGKRLNGYDRVEADKTGFATLRHEYFLIGREIARLETADGQHTLDGPFGIEMFEKLDGYDFAMMRVAAVRWRESFRASKQKVQGKPRQPDIAAGPENSLESS